MGAAGTMELVRSQKRLYVKRAGGVLEIDMEQAPPPEGELRAYLIHEDGEMRIPVLLRSGVLIRGYDQEIYSRLLLQG